MNGDPQFNPYRSPDVAEVSGDAIPLYYRDGKFLYVRDGAELPERCIRTNEKVDEAGWRKRKRLTWIPPWALIPILSGFLPFLILLLFLQKKAKITYSLSKDARESLFRRRCIGLGVMAFGLLAAFAGGSLFQGDAAFLAMTGGSIAAFIGLPTASPSIPWP